MANSLLHTIPAPVKNAYFSIAIPFLDADGDPVDPTSPDTEVSKDGGVTFADCTNEITTGGGNGAGYITLTPSEMNADMVIVSAKSANAKATVLTIYPYTFLGLNGSQVVSVTASISSSIFVLSPGHYTSMFSNFNYRSAGLWIVSVAGTGIGQARPILAWDPTNWRITVAPALETAFSTDTDLNIGALLGTGPHEQNMGLYGGFVR